MTRISRFLYLSVLAPLVSGCVSPQASHTPSVSIDPQAQATVESFKQEALNEGVSLQITDLSIQFVTAESWNQSEMAVCQTDDSGASTPTIYVSQEIWDSLDDDGREELLFHELGHCVLNRGHDQALDNGLPVSLMHGTFMGGALYQANRAQLLHELFTQQNLSGGLPLYRPQNVFLPDFSASPNS